MKPGQLSRLVVAAMALAIWTTRAAADGDDLSNLSLEQLMQEPVTSVSKKVTRLSEAAAAIAVVTQDDIRRLGITTLPDALRLVPGLDVAQISSNVWAVSSRGFNAQFANKLLVLIDGRSVYSPASAGVFWNAQDIMIEDVDRIEVIRGPGATLWGANAVNGVINIITKRAVDTQGTLVSAGEASDNLARDVARYGGRIGPDTYYRAYAKYLDQGGFDDTTHTVDTGGWRAVQTGFRLDTRFEASNDFTLQGDIYSSDAGEPLTSESLESQGYRIVDAVDHNNGSNLVARWTHTYSPDSALTLQTYFDHVNQGSVGGSEHRDTYDVDFQHGFRIGASNDLLWGAGVRSSTIDETSTIADLVWTPEKRDIRLFNVFVQDEWTVVPDKLRLTLGTKFEHSSISGSNLQPNVRLAWMPTERQTVWAAVSRSTRTPALFELDLKVDTFTLSAPGALPVLAVLNSNPHLLPEQLTAYELGYRFAPVREVSVDIASFINRYAHEITSLLGTPQFVPGPGAPYILVPFMEQNVATLTSYGIETTAHWQAAQNWEVTAGYTFLRIDSGSAPSLAQQSPHQQVQLRSYLDLPRGFQLNAALFYVDAVYEPSGSLVHTIPPYVRGDLGIVWKRDALSVGVWGQNLLKHEHVEFADVNTPILTEVPRSVLGKITWSF